MKKYRILRLLTLLTILMALFCSPVTAYATTSAGDASNGYLSQMANEAFSAYMVFIKLVCPFAALSVAKSGFEILFSVWLGKGEQEVDKAKKNVMLIFSATICLVLLPMSFGWVKGKVSSNGWQPPSGLSPLTGDWSNLTNGADSTTPDSSENTTMDPSKTGEIENSYHDPASNQDISYWTYVPENATSNMPLIVFLHGNNSSLYSDSKNVRTYGMMNAAKRIYGNKYPFIGLQPQASSYGWENKPLKALIDHVVQEYSIDRNHIIITGHSMGAFGVWSYTGLYGNYFSAAVPVSWYAPDNATDGYISNWAKVPIRMYYGTSEAESEYPEMDTKMEENVKKINDRGGNATLYSLSDMSHGATKESAYTKELFEWMIHQ